MSAVDALRRRSTGAAPDPANDPPQAAYIERAVSRRGSRSFMRPFQDLARALAMHLKTLRLISFRAHERSECEFASSVNLFYGPNGAGKTNILEAIHYLCLAKSFVASSDRYAVRRGAGHMEVEGVVARGDRRDLRVRLVYVPGEGKRIFVNGAPLDRLSDIIGQLPIVVFSPEDATLTAGGPDERRRFMDNILSQAGPLYLDTLLKFRKVLKQRNRLLSEINDRHGTNASGVLASWDHELVRLGAHIIAARARFAEEFSKYLNEAYREIEAAVERPTLQYATIDGYRVGMDEEDVAELYREKLQESAHRERRRELTLVGPHRDELVFRLDKMLVRRYASQGQHRTFGMATKLAKYFYLHDRTGEHPILLLDDVFDHLDRRRSTAFLDLLQSDRIGQSIITATELRPFAEVVQFGADETAARRVHGGVIQPSESPDPRHASAEKPASEQAESVQPESEQVAS